MNASLPAGFEDYFRHCWNDKDVATLVRGLGEEVPVSIRLNAARLPADTWPAGAVGRVPWCPEGVYLSQRPQFTADPLLHAGAYYVQEASSMFLAHVLRTLILHPSLSLFHSHAALDLCAAPGGKSTILRSLLPPECQLVSNEPLRQRAQVLAENLTKWGADNVVVTQAYAREIAQVALADRSFEGFDIILADVPCSGEGMIRKEEEAIRQWSPAFVAECAALQRSIVADIWPALRPNGILIYSTCTFNPEEDEQNVEWIASELGADIIPIPVDPSWNIKGDLRREKPFGDLPCHHFIPGEVQGEGFFIAVLKKQGKDIENVDSIESEWTHGSKNPGTTADKDAKKRKDKKKKGKNSSAARADQCDYATSLERLIHEKLTTIPTSFLDATDAPRVELSLPDAVRYLQRESLVLEPSTPKGIVQVCFRGQRLGLMKNLGSRANNLYPKEWRIRSSFISPGCIIPE